MTEGLIHTVIEHGMYNHRIVMQTCEELLIAGALKVGGGASSSKKSFFLASINRNHANAKSVDQNDLDKEENMWGKKIIVLDEEDT